MTERAAPPTWTRRHTVAALCLAVVVVGWSSGQTLLLVLSFPASFGFGAAVGEWGAVAVAGVPLALALLGGVVAGLASGDAEIVGLVLVLTGPWLGASAVAVALGVVVGRRLGFPRR